MKKVIAAILLVAMMTMTFGSAIASGYEAIDEMEDLEDYCVGKLQALCVIYQVGGTDMMSDLYTELFYRYFKLYIAADNVKMAEQLKEIKNQGKELPDIEDREEMLYTLDQYVDATWMDYINGVATKKEYLDWLVYAVKSHVDEIE